MRPSTKDGGNGFGSGWQRLRDLVRAEEEKMGKKRPAAKFGNKDLFGRRRCMATATEVPATEARRGGASEEDGDDSGGSGAEERGRRWMKTAATKERSVAAVATRPTMWTRAAGFPSSKAIGDGVQGDGSEGAIRWVGGKEERGKMDAEDLAVVADGSGQSDEGGGRKEGFEACRRRRGRGRSSAAYPMS